MSENDGSLFRLDGVGLLSHTTQGAARVLDTALHVGRAEERDGGVWMDDLLHRLLDVGAVTAPAWRRRPKHALPPDMRFVGELQRDDVFAFGLPEHHGPWRTVVARTRGRVIATCERGTVTMRCRPGDVVVVRQ